MYYRARFALKGKMGTPVTAKQAEAGGELSKGIYTKPRKKNQGKNSPQILFA